MRFGIFYELQLPKPWSQDDEQRLIAEALDQILVSAGQRGYDVRLAVRDLLALTGARPLAGIAV